MKTTTLVAAALVVVGLLSGCATGTEVADPDKDLPVCTVINKEQSVQVSGSDGDTHSEQVYYIYTQECGSFQIFNLIDGQGADLYGQMIVGHQYRIDSFGTRIALLGAYPQITAVEDVTK